MLEQACDWSDTLLKRALTFPNFVSRIRKSKKKRESKKLSKILLHEYLKKDFAHETITCDLQN